jgi:MFS transporter, Spinster family, sphingosine-1-phosphate transporter
MSDLSQKTSSKETNLGYAWFIVALLVPVALLNYLDRQMLATMKNSMMADIPDIQTDANWGFILGCFKWVYAFLSPFAGYVADRFSRRVVVVLSLFFWSLITLTTGYVETYHQLIWARALMGISEAFYIPAALAMIADYHVGETRSRAVGMHQMGIYIGVILGGFAGYVADAPSLGWRVAFYTCGLIGVVYAVPLFLYLRNSPQIIQKNEAAISEKNAGNLLNNPNFLLLVLYFTLPALAGWVVKDWMPAILQEKFQFEKQGMAGVLAVLPVQIASIIGVAIGGWLADRAMQHYIRGRIYVSALGMLLFLPALFGVGSAHYLGMAIGCLVLYGIGWGFFDCNNMPILCQIASPQHRARAYGIMNFASIGCGGLADWGFGSLRDQKVSLSVIFGAFAAISLLSVLIVLLIRPQQIDDTAHSTIH